MPIAKLPEEPLKPVPPSLPPSSQKPPTCFQAPVRGKSWKIFEPGHILMLVKQLSISNLDHPDTSPPWRAEKVCKLIAASNPWLTPHHQSERGKLFLKGGMRHLPRCGKVKRPRWQYQMQLGCKQPGCYQGIGAADSPRPSPNLSSVIKEDDLDWKTSIFPDVVILKGFWWSGRLQFLFILYWKHRKICETALVNVWIVKLSVGIFKAIWRLNV